MNAITLGLLAFIGALFGSLVFVMPSAVGLYRHGRERGYNRRRSLAFIIN